MSTEAMKLALAALESCDTGHITDGSRQWYDERLVDKAITALDEALAQPQQEPVAIVDDSGVIVVCSYHYKPGDKLYTTPLAQRKPLMDEKIDAIWDAVITPSNHIREFVRAIEAAHGIKGDA